MSRTRDLGRSREIIARRRQERASAVWDPAKQADLSWMKYTRCKLCGTKICVNNNPKKEIDLSSARYHGVIVCWRCRRFVPLYQYLQKQCEKGDKKAIKV